MSLPRPRLESQVRILESGEVLEDTDVDMYTLEGKSGYVKNVYMAVETAHADGQLTFIYILCDDREVLKFSPLNLSDRGFGNTTQPFLLLEYNVDGLCRLLITDKYHFRKKLVLRVRNNLNDIDLVAVRGHVVLEGE